MVRKYTDLKESIGSIRTDELKYNSLPYPKIFNNILHERIYFEGDPLPFPDNLNCGVSFTTLVSIEEITAPELVYDLSVPGDENFVLANGILVHNSGSYPDNEQEFGRLFNKILPFSTQNGVKITLIDPLATKMKRELIEIGNNVGVPWELTWSCYSKEKHHCSKCGPCFMRKTAFKRNGLLDPVFKHEWDDPFWEGCKECQPEKPSMSNLDPSKVCGVE